LLLELIMAGLFGLAWGLGRCSSPVSLGLYTFSAALLVGLAVSVGLSTWYGSMAILVFLGGMLVMFAYFLAICPNQKVELSWPVQQSLAVGLVCAFTWGLAYPHLVSPAPFTGFYQGDAGLLIALAVTLLFTLLVAVKVARLYRGPLRPFTR
jgi:hypothetical protein